MLQRRGFALNLISLNTCDLWLWLR
jgi:hypothetical protein